MFDIGPNLRDVLEVITVAILFIGIVYVGLTRG